MQRIALFGTSADPPTEGHRTILLWLSQRFDRVAVWASDNPFKTHQTPLEHRKTMLQILINTLQVAANNVALYEQLSSPRSLETVQKARQIWGDKSALFLVVGSDLLPQIPQWYRSEELLTLVELLIIPRPGHPINESDWRRLVAMGGRFAIAQLDVPAVSSTDYRQRLASTAVTPSVEDYIQREGLYQWQNAASNP